MVEMAKIHCFSGLLFRKKKKTTMTIMNTTKSMMDQRNEPACHFQKLGHEEEAAGPGMVNDLRINVDEMIEREEELIQSSHVSDPGALPPSDSSGSPRLRRSCSNLETQVAVFSSSPLDRVNEWVNSLGDDPAWTVDLEFDQAFESTEPTKMSSGRGAAEEIAQTKLAVMSAFAGLRVINLSGNSIVHIAPGVLPKSLQSLDLSRNKMAAIEGLRELPRLRVLNLSYNKISRIGHGLGNCTLIKELYLAGNKISDVEGLHRLLKLQVLDLSFNRLTTAKSLGQLISNYQSLQVLNLLGNPVLVNVGVDQLRKVVTGLLPRLAYLNRQAIKPIRGRDGALISKVAIGAAGPGLGARSRQSRQAGPSPSQSAGRAHRRKPKPSASAPRR
ncbi:outer arm dynein light chain 1 protein [Wolffia australiana]